MTKKDLNRVSVILHEIRSPITAMIGLLDITMTSMNKRRETEKNLTTMRKLCNYLLNLSNSALFTDKYLQTSHPIEKSRFRLLDVIEEMSELFEFMAMRKGITFETQVPTGKYRDVLGNDTLLKEILINLLSNSIKYTNSGGRIRFTVSLKETAEDTAVTMTIADNGIGMSREYLKQIFVPYSEENNTPKEGSTGLGMPIVLEIVRSLGGTIDVESEKGRGTKFTINLRYPFCFEKPRSPDLSGKRILIADDSPISSEILKEFILAAHGIPETASDGKQVYDAFLHSSEGFYDLILMDMQMPQLSGDETAKMIRNLSRTDAKTIPIIAQSASGLLEDEKKALASGMNDYLCKPVKCERLYQMIAKYIRKES